MRFACASARVSREALLRKGQLSQVCQIGILVLGLGEDPPLSVVVGTIVTVILS